MQKTLLVKFGKHSWW